MGSNAFEVLSSVYGISQDEIKDIEKWIQSNGTALAGCSGHDFRALNPAGDFLLTRYRCAVCGGKVDGDAYRWYQTGRAHALKSQGA